MTDCVVVQQIEEFYA